MKGITVKGIVVTAVVGLLCSGCSTMNWIFGDWNYKLGDAYSANTTNMIANPDNIDAEARPIEGLDGKTAEGVMTNYERTQTERKSAPKSSIINIGTGSR